MPVNTIIHREWQERQEHSLAKHYQRLAWDAKGQTLTKAERKRIKLRQAYEMQCLSAGGVDNRGRKNDYATFIEKRRELHLQQRKVYEMQCLAMEGKA